MNIRSRIADMLRRALSIAQSRLEPQPLALSAPAIEAPIAEPQTETFEAYANRWLATRIAGGMASGIDYRSNLDNHILGVLGPRPIGAITSAEIRSLVQTLRTKNSARSRPGSERKLAALTVHGLCALLNNIFNSAIADEVIEKNPCKFKKGDLPKKKHAVVGFREKAVYTRDEILTILDLDNKHPTQIPAYWRDLYRATFFTGCRIGEICALTFEKIDLDLKPLGKVTIAHSFSSKNRRTGGTKTGDVRLVPIHPAWAPHLRAWVERGYKKYTGIDPRPEALVFPAKGRGKKVGQLINRSNTVCRHRLKDDLAALGLRDRRVHDFRRTFVTLACNADGANTDILRRLTHARGGSVHDGYREIPWEVMCRELRKLDMSRDKKTTPGQVDRSDKEADTRGDDD